MNDLNKIKFFPKFSLKGYEGMGVTGDSWNMAHDEHRDALRGHILAMHRAGIICGLEVRANDPADHYVFISPGAAVDSYGRVIVVDQTIAYDFGEEGTGTYMLLLGYGEHEKENTDAGIKTMQHEYIIAARQSLPKQPTVELARVEISKKGAVIKNAADEFRPKADELDLRYRLDKDGLDEPVRAAVVCIPEDNDAVNEGWRVLAQSLQLTKQENLIVDFFENLDEHVSGYDLLYVAASGTFTPSDAQKTQLKNFYNNGGGILLEGLDPAGTEALKALADGIKMEAISYDNSRFYREPYYFRLPPEQVSEKNILCGKKIILCADPTASAWCGSINGKPISRGDIRTNLEWGANLVKYCACQNG